MHLSHGSGYSISSGIGAGKAERRDQNSVKTCGKIRWHDTPGEAFAILVRFLDSSSNIQQRLICFQALTKSMKAPELSCEIVSCLSTYFQVTPSKVIAFVRDGASVNTAAVEQVKMLLYPQASDTICAGASHCLDNVVQHFETPT